ncbi:HNH endonuclease signature motif containing protein [Polyangium sp. 15x6]|uniref:HNH endonuclease n=1 Tax=Polyangium sp. 15x6 TaxID=3042687 RepID=UPI00249C28FC|nr:HNH endonuclease signature motif containing protein [Polyangium sp. 15x6]MDI3291177.1 HNH endonuclease signature motif containing protein [Polyangium sp. 15x6]
MAWLPSIRPPGGTLSLALESQSALDVRRFSLVMALVVLCFVLISSGCAASRDPTMARIFEAPNVIHVCVRPPNVPNDKRIWGVTSDGAPFFGVREVDRARGNGSPVFVFNADSPPESARLLPIPYNKLECPARTPRPKPRVAAAKAKAKEAEEKKDEAKKAEGPKPLPRPIARSPEQERCTEYREPGQTRRRSGTGSRACTRVLVKRRDAEQAVADKQPAAIRELEPPEPAEPRELPASAAQAYEDWGLSPAETSALAEDRARECLQGLCHARHPNFVPKSKKKPAETHNGQSLSTGSGSGGGASSSRPASKPAAAPAQPVTTVKTTTRTVAKPNGAAAGQAPSTGTSTTTTVKATTKPGSGGSAGGSRAGKPFTAKGKAEIDAANAERNGGVNVCETCRTQTIPAEKSQRGVRPPGNERQRDHKIPQSKGGDGDPLNGQILCRDCNLKKRDTL